MKMYKDFTFSKKHRKKYFQFSHYLKYVLKMYRYLETPANIFSLADTNLV